MSLQQSKPEPCEDVLLELCLCGVGRYDLSVGLDGNAAELRMQSRHDRTAWQLPTTVPSRPNWHAAELPASAEYQARSGANDMSRRSDGHATELQAGDGTANLPDRNDGHTAELSADSMPCWPNRNAAELQGCGSDSAADLSSRHDGYAA